MSYSKYFDIDSKFFPAVTDALINENKVSWKEFNAHETFINLLKEFNIIINGEDDKKKSLWVEGAYGTGKSHAIFTLKEILSPHTTKEEVKDYFNNENIDSSLTKSYCDLKDEKILTVFRYGSSGIRSDIDLINAIQKSILEELEKQGIENKGENSLKDNIIEWLSQKKGKDFFNTANEESKDFPGENANDILEQLKTLQGKALFDLLKDINDFGKKNGILAFQFEIRDLKNWIANIIDENGFDSIVFIWDEFTEFFTNNIDSFTGLQDIAELSNTKPFYLIIVTHETDTFLRGDKRKVLDRATSCRIELPDNMAFKLIGRALRVNELNKAEWETHKKGLKTNINEISDKINKIAKITVDDLFNILPIQPYTALILKNIATNFGANQRSMFSYIKNEDKGGFISYINKNDIYDNPVLTIDYLWNYFYVNDTKDLNNNIRNILSLYNEFESDEKYDLSDKEKRLLKTILFMQSIYKTMELHPKFIEDKDVINLIVPTEENITNAYIGDSIKFEIHNILEALVEKNVLLASKWKNKIIIYTAVTRGGGRREWVENRKVELRTDLKTSKIIKNTDFKTEFNFDVALKYRYEIAIATCDDFKAPIATLKQHIDKTPNLGIVLFLARDNEISTLKEKIADELKNINNKIVYLESNTYFTEENFRDYIDALANYEYDTTIDPNPSSAKKYETDKTDIINDWVKSIKNNSFKVNTDKDSITGIDSLKKKLYGFISKVYPLSLDHLKLHEPMFKDLDAGKYACVSPLEKKLLGTFNNTSIVRNFNGIWDEEDFNNWPKDSIIYQIKKNLDDYIKKQLAKNSQLSHNNIWNFLQGEPYGFLPSNLSAFVMGILLRDYTSNSYRVYDGYNSAEFIKEEDVNNIKFTKHQNYYDFISNAISKPKNNKYVELFLQPIGEEEEKFISLSSKLFKLDSKKCLSANDTLSEIRGLLSNSYPFWVLKHITNDKIAIELIEDYTNLLNPENSDDSDNENQIVKRIGKKYINNPDLEKILLPIFSKEKCKEAIAKYIKDNYNNLVNLAKSIGDNDEYYLILLKKKFTGDGAWIWNESDCKDKIDDVICEYKIIEYSNIIIPNTNRLESVVNSWKEILENIKISHDYLKEYTDMKNLIECLYRINTDSSYLFTKENKENFKEALYEKIADFKKFYQNQFEVFKKCFEKELSDSPYSNPIKAENMFNNKISNNHFNDSAVAYLTYVDDIIGQTDIWVEITGTNSPNDWCKKYLTPISIVLPNSVPFTEVSYLFDKINNGELNKEESKKLSKLFENYEFQQSLLNEEIINKAFKDKFLKIFAFIVDNEVKIKNLKNILYKIDENVYGWANNPTIQKELSNFVKKEYMLGKRQEALNKIKTLDNDTLKLLISKMIEDNPEFGVEVLKS